MDLKFAEETNCYWLQRLGALSNAVGLPTVQEHVMVVQYFPYWSSDGTAVFDGLPSQEYSLQLVREALDAGKLVMVMRAADKWTKAIPALRNAITNRNRSPYVSPGNLRNGNFDKVVAALRAPISG